VAVSLDNTPGGFTLIIPPGAYSGIPNARLETATEKAKLVNGGLFLLSRYVAAMNQTYLVGLLTIWPKRLSENPETSKTNL
jgi:hypothetical protein